MPPNPRRGGKKKNKQHPLPRPPPPPAPPPPPPPRAPQRCSHGPVGRTAVRDLIALFVEKVSANVLRMFDTFQIVPHFLVAALLVRTDSIVQHSSAQCFPRRTARAKGKRHQNSQHEEQCLRH